jgi:hypothetical protein
VTLTLRQRRARGQLFEPRFFEKSELFWPIVPRAERFASFSDWPDVSAYARVFDGEPPVRFEASPPKLRRPEGPVDPKLLYDGRITLDRCVPTRPGSWHDFLNALVWGSFPRAKQALHARQHAAIVRSLPPGAEALPPARTREHDALALIDEGGVVAVEDARGRGYRVVFGHAIFEGLVLEVRATIARAVACRADEIPEEPAARVALADALLADRLADERLVPEDLPRIALRDCVSS